MVSGIHQGSWNASLVDKGIDAPPMFTIIFKLHFFPITFTCVIRFAQPTGEMRPRFPSEQKAAPLVGAEVARD